MSNGLDDQWDGEVVETLENLFQLCKMREMADRKATQCKQLKDTQAITMKILAPKQYTHRRERTPAYP
jgi:hypothetical protein